MGRPEPEVGPHTAVRRGEGISRRGFVQGVAGVGLAAGAAHLVGSAAQPAHARQAQTMPLVGMLVTGGPGGNPLTAFGNRLVELGWIDGETVRLEYRYAEGDEMRLPALAAELARLPLAVLVAAGGMPAVEAAREATSTIPIVMTNGSDPVAAGIVASLARPGGNVTGVITLSHELSPLRVRVLADSFPGATRVAVLWNPTNAPAAQAYAETQAAAATHGLQLRPVPVRGLDELVGALGTLARDRPDAMLVLNGPVLLDERRRSVELATEQRLPAMYGDRPFAADGGLLACGQSGPSLFQHAAVYVDQLLRGAGPAELPVVQPPEGYVVVNVRTAQAQGFTIPPTIMVEATELLF